MKKILIISPHYPPSNLAAVHRARLFAENLPFFGWEPIILTVHEKYYEESLDWELLKLVPANQRIEKVEAFKITKPRFIGDIGLRAFIQLRKKALEIIQSEKVDFLYITIPSFYVSLIGPYVNKMTGIKYGIDYIDPWVHEFPGSEKVFSRHWFSTIFARYLEPIAVKNAALITGVSEGYYMPIFKRNSNLISKIITAAMPYGGSENDFNYVHDDINTNLAKLISEKPDKKSIFNFIYAGALLPKSLVLLDEIFKILTDLFANHNNERIGKINITFIGTAGVVKPLAEKYGIWKTIINEYPERLAYLEVLKKLCAADGIFILGSTESHYTPSKIFQGILSRKPIFAIIHKLSSVVEVIDSTKCGIYLPIDEKNYLEILSKDLKLKLFEFLAWSENYNYKSIDLLKLNEFTAKKSTEKLVKALEKAIYT